MSRVWVILVVAMMPTDAWACHRFSRWYYPWPQRCSVHTTALIIPAVIPPVRDITIPLPELSPVDGLAPDDETKARLLLRGILVK